MRLIKKAIEFIFYFAFAYVVFTNPIFFQRSTVGQSEPVRQALPASEPVVGESPDFMNEVLEAKIDVIKEFDQAQQKMDPVIAESAIHQGGAYAGLFEAPQQAAGK